MIRSGLFMSVLNLLIRVQSIMYNVLIKINNIYNLVHAFSYITVRRAAWAQPQKYRTRSAGCSCCVQYNYCHAIPCCAHLLRLLHACSPPQIIISIGCCHWNINNPLPLVNNWMVMNHGHTVINAWYNNTQVTIVS